MMRAATAEHTPMPSPPERRKYQRWPLMWERAYTPLDRAMLLFGGDASRLAEACGCTVNNIYKWRRTYNGFFPDAALPAVELAMKGWDLPHGFLTEAGRFNAPKKRTLRDGGSAASSGQGAG